MKQLRKKKPNPLLIPEHKLAFVVEYHIRFILNSCGWNKSLAAGILGIDRRSLQRLEKKWNLRYYKNNVGGR